MGRLQRKEVSISMASVLSNNISGGKITDCYPDPCYRCKETKFHICQDGDDLVAFCANEKCLKQDSDRSKEDARAEYLKRIERNEFGQIITGAEKFRMGSSYKNACLANWVAHLSVQSAVQYWTTNSKPFLISMGSPGTGKTYAAAAILNLLFEKKEEVYYTTHRRFIEEIHRAIEEGKSQHSVTDKISYKKFLILDDLGSATCTEWQKEMLLELIDRRYSNKDKTFITTNLSEKQLYEFLGDRTASRIFDKRNEIFTLWTEDNRRNPEFND